MNINHTKVKIIYYSLWWSTFIPNFTRFAYQNEFLILPVAILLLVAVALQRESAEDCKLCGYLGVCPKIESALFVMNLSSLLLEFPGFDFHYWQCIWKHLQMRWRWSQGQLFSILNNWRWMTLCHSDCLKARTVLEKGLRMKVFVGNNALPSSERRCTMH